MKQCQTIPGSQPVLLPAYLKGLQECHYFGCCTCCTSSKAIRAGDWNAAIRTFSRVSSYSPTFPRKPLIMPVISVVNRLVQEMSAVHKRQIWMTCLMMLSLKELSVFVYIGEIKNLRSWQELKTKKRFNEISWILWISLSKKNDKGFEMSHRSFIAARTSACSDEHSISAVISDTMKKVLF